MTMQPNNKCTCPSGDGSLRWPCPVHPAASAHEAVGEVYQGSARRPQAKLNAELPVGTKLYAAPVTAAPVATIVAAMRNFADVADRCQITEANAGSVIRTWADQLEASTPAAPVEPKSPSYDGLLLMMQSVCGALSRAGLTDCDDPGEAIDVIRERLERRVAELERQLLARTPAAPGIDLAALAAKITDHLCEQDYDIGGRDELLQNVREAIDASPNGEVHPDDLAVDAFAAAMKAKLADARAKGRGGWNGDQPGMHQRLSDMLRAHVEKGDPRDVANFCMFLHQRGESISPNAGSEVRDSVLTELVQAISAFKGKRGAFMALGAQDERTIRLWWAVANAQASDAEVPRG